MTILCDYDPAWKLAFSDLRAVYENVFGEPILAVEHIGSTSIEGLAAKPILDIDLVIDSMSSFPSVKTKLELLGYVHNGDQGVPQREAFKREIDRYECGDTGKLNVRL